METESSLSSKKIYVSLEPVPEPRIYKYLENGREVLDEYVLFDFGSRIWFTCA